MARKITKIPNSRITIAGLSTILGVPANTLMKSVFRATHDGTSEYYLHDILRAMWALRKGSDESASGDGMSIDEAKRQKTVEEHRKLKRINDVEEGHLIEWSEARTTIQSLVEPATRELKNFLLNKLPAQAQGQTAGEIRNMVTPAYNDWCKALHNLSDKIADSGPDGDEHENDDDGNPLSGDVPEDVLSVDDECEGDETSAGR